ncbi:ComEC/Rec2 family competence protein [Fretibacter rubidus]|uniref:ComEC/Rec2 family competence protein n=1 Tax=Fretibacter rubidus TaxID=570162 RepID=UPI00352B0EBA
MVSKARALWATVWQRPTRIIAYDFEWGVAAFAAGIALYFALPFEPAWRILVLISVSIYALYVLSSRFDQSRRALWLVVPLLSASLGLFRATWHSDAVAEPSVRESAYTVTGWIEAVERSGTGYRWRIRVTEFDGYGDPPKPYRVRISVRKAEAMAGDAVRLRAILAPPPPPVMPGGYDPARKAYFDGISAYGFRIGTPEFVDLNGLSWEARAQRSLAKFRYQLADRILASSPEATAGLQVALLTGVRSYIPEEQIIALRTAGLAHVLAISGLHMGLMSGGAFYLATLLLVLIAPLSRRYDVRKPAAIIGALVATAYLALSGASVATQRAFIMVIIVYLAVILDRRAFSMRSVSLAALITLLLHPESLVSAGFQMSFAAVAALVVVYQYWQGGRQAYAQGLVARTKSGLVTLSITSLVAGSATGGYAIMHFGRMATYGFLGNLLAMPVFTFVVMPAALATLIAIPLGLEAVPLYVMGQALNVVIIVSDWVSGWPGALGHVKAAPGWVLGLYSVAFLWMCLGGPRLRIAAVVLSGLCFVAWATHPVPNMRVSDQGRIAFWEAKDGTQDAQTLYVSSKRADRYGREQFMQRAGEGEEAVTITPYQDARALCDALACRFKVSGHWISIISHPSEVMEACENSDLVVLTQRQAGPVARRGCGDKLLDRRNFARGGAHDIYLSGDTIKTVPAVTDARKERPWGKAPVLRRR